MDSIDKQLLTGIYYLSVLSAIVAKHKLDARGWIATKPNYNKPEY